MQRQRLTSPVFSGRSAAWPCSNPLLRARAFTLIEILIVVAIIGILAAIALVNMQEAQTRSKAARAKADMRTLATGLEAFFVSNRGYPPPLYDQEFSMGSTRVHFVSNQLTTPVAYLTNVQAILDPFSESPDPRLRRYGYNTHVFPFGLSRDMTGPWCLFSRGPDLAYEPNQCEPSYDPTNGAVSRGNIYRAQSAPDFLHVCSN